MSDNEYTTHWICDGQRIDDFSEVEKLVDAGHIVAEVSAAIQRNEALRRALIEKWHAEAIERYNRLVAEQSYRQSPEGLRAEAIRHAQQNPGGWVSSQVEGCPELDRYTPSRTTVFK